MATSQVPRRTRFARLPKGNESCISAVVGRCTDKGDFVNEKDLSTEPDEEAQDVRFSGPHGNEEWAVDPGQAQTERADQADRLG